MRGLSIRLHDKPVGVLETGAHTRFRLSSAYLEMVPRPVLGQAFEDDPRAWTTGGGGELPPFFSNLLPEGALRELVSRDREISEEAEFELLAALGEDLPGAVTAHLVEDAELVEEGGQTEARPVPAQEDGGIRFALSGVQSKLSMNRVGARLVYPASGKGGDWIVKLPSGMLPLLPENEWATMSWASASGIRTASHELVPTSALENVPIKAFEGRSGSAFVTRRFDRPEPGRRVHQEDFAQVLDVYPDSKYRTTNYETIARLVSKICGPSELDELVRRYVFMVLSGNGDMHLKNWSLQYPDGVTAQLTPAYDLVASTMYAEKETLALNLAKSKAFTEVTRASFTRLAQKVELSEAHVTSVVERAIEATMDAWSALTRRLELPREYEQAIGDHLRRLPLLTRH